MVTKKNNQILGIPISIERPEFVLEQIIKGLTKRMDFVHVLSLNPENMVQSSKDPLFKKIVLEAKYIINDGVGVVLASRFINNVFVPRLTGVDLMQKLINEASRESLRVLLIGGKPNLAERLADCYNQSYPASQFKGIVGFKDVRAPSQMESKDALSIVAAMRPHLLFVAFGSPEQEKWIYENRASLQGVTCIGVGGSFDFLVGDIARAPKLIRLLGFEWLFRLVNQPWRWRRQLRLWVFVWLVLKEKFNF
mgnify:CR=1 FL=1